MRKVILFVLSLTLISSLLYFNFPYFSKSKNELQTEGGNKTLVQKPKVTIDDKEIFVDVARSDEEKARGLSGKKSLNENEGMLFIFDQKYQPSFWMFDMNFPLDIIWISDDVIVDIDRNVPIPKPNTLDYQLPLYTPEKPINYVLEVNAGFCEKNSIEVGDSVEFNF